MTSRTVCDVCYDCQHFIWPLQYLSLWEYRTKQPMVLFYRRIEEYNVKCSKYDKIEGQTSNSRIKTSNWERNSSTASTVLYSSVYKFINYGSQGCVTLIFAIGAHDFITELFSDKIYEVNRNFNNFWNHNAYGSGSSVSFLDSRTSKRPKLCAKLSVKYLCAKDKMNDSSARVFFTDLRDIDQDCKGLHSTQTDL